MCPKANHIASAVPQSWVGFCGAALVQLRKQCEEDGLDLDEIVSREPKKEDEKAKHATDLALVHEKLSKISGGVLRTYVEAKNFSECRLDYVYQLIASSASGTVRLTSFDFAPALKVYEEQKGIPPCLTSICTA